MGKFLRALTRPFFYEPHYLRFLNGDGLECQHFGQFGGL